jgi:hypothetical protein
MLRLAHRAGAVAKAVVGVVGDVAVGVYDHAADTAA